MYCSQCFLEDVLNVTLERHVCPKCGADYSETLTAPQRDTLLAIHRALRALRPVSGNHPTAGPAISTIMATLSHFRSKIHHDIANAELPAAYHATFEPPEQHP